MTATQDAKRRISGSQPLDGQNHVQGPASQNPATRIAFSRTGRRAGRLTKGQLLRLIRQTCLECSDSQHSVTWCSCDGVHSTACPLWRVRFGLDPQTCTKRYGPRLVTPAMMPPVSARLDDLPASVAAASTCPLI